MKMNDKYIHIIKVCQESTMYIFVEETASDRIRTDDPLLTMEVLCRLSYRGE